MSSKKIEFEYDGNPITLEYNRAAIKQMERNGFKMRDFDNMPMTCIDALFRGAFYMHHKNMENATKDKIWDDLGGHQELIQALVEMYRETIEVFMDVDKNLDQGNVRWTVTE